MPAQVSFNNKLGVIDKSSIAIKQCWAAYLKLGLTPRLIEVNEQEKAC